MNNPPITLCVITRNSEDRIEKMLKRHKDVCSEILVIDQNSTDNTYDIASKDASWVFRRKAKGTADPDRNWLFSLASNPWILYLDDDEYLSDDLIKNLEEVIKDGYDVYWLPTKNLVNGIDIRDILGPDYHPRLFKRGAVIFPDQIHTWPKPVDGVNVGFLNYGIIHDRTLEKVIAANRERNTIADKEKIAMQESFIKTLQEFLEKKKNGINGISTKQV